MATNEERSEATRARLLAIARKRFGTKGYAATYVEDLVRRAGVTKGAFYHHFDDKQSVFLAVLEDAQQRLAQACVATARGEDASWRALAGCPAFLDACTDPEIQQCILLDGPAGRKPTATPRRVEAFPPSPGAPWARISASRAPRRGCGAQYRSTTCVRNSTFA